MSVASESSLVMLRSPGAFAAALPSLVGFHPSQSLVAVFLGEGQVIVTMRLDLPEELGECAEHVTATGTRVAADEVILVAFTSRGAGELPLRDGVETIRSACDATGLSVRDALLVDGGRYWSYLCSSSECCPPEGVPMPQGSTVLDAERVGLGLPVPAESRDAVVQRYVPRPDLAPSPAVREQAEAVLQVPLAERAAQVWEEVCLLAAAPVPEDAARDLMRSRLQVAMEHVTVRDFVLASIALTDQDSASLVDVVVQAALTAPEDLRPRVAGAAAALLAACGESSIATMCLLELAAGESLADLVRASVEAAIPPPTLREVFASAMPMVEQQLQDATPPSRRSRSRRTTH